MAEVHFPESKPRHPRQRDLCRQCSRGDHSFSHTQIGCIRIVGNPPADFVCRCAKPFGGVS